MSGCGGDVEGGGNVYPSRWGEMLYRECFFALLFSCRSCDVDRFYEKCVTDDYRASPDGNTKGGLWDFGDREAGPRYGSDRNNAPRKCVRSWLGVTAFMFPRWPPFPTPSRHAAHPLLGRSTCSFPRGQYVLRGKKHVPYCPPSFAPPSLSSRFFLFYF